MWAYIPEKPYDAHPDDITVLSLCTGGAGLDLGLGLALGTARPICYVEIEFFAIRHLVEKIESGLLPAAPVWTDLKTFDARPWAGLVDLVAGGYPCQPFSLAGQRRGTDDPRHLWPYIAGIVGEVRPGACFFENVPGHVSMGADAVVGELEELGYRCSPQLESAAGCGASHERERLFIVALADSDRQIRSAIGERSDAGADGRRYAARCCRTELGDAERVGIQNFDSFDAEPLSVAGCRELFAPGPADVDAWLAVIESGDWHLLPALPGRNEILALVESVENLPTEIESCLRRMADGMAARVDRLRMCGNGVFPVAAALAFLAGIADLAVRDDK